MNYITRVSEGVFLHAEEPKIIPLGLRKVLNDLAMENGSTFSGRIDSASIMIKSKSKVPLFINDDILLIPSKSIRQYDVVFFNLFHLHHIKQYNEQTILIFCDGHQLVVNARFTVIQKQIKKGNVLVQNIIQRKCLHVGLINRFYNEYLV